MSSRHPFDKIFRDKLGDHEMPIPDGIWNNIEKEIKKNRFRPLLPWFIAVGVILLAGSIYWFGGMYDETIDIDKNTAYQNSVLPSQENESQENNSKGDIAILDKEVPENINNQIDINLNKYNINNTYPENTKTTAVDQESKAKTKSQENFDRSLLAETVKDSKTTQLDENQANTSKEGLKVRENSKALAESDEMVSSSSSGPEIGLNKDLARLNYSREVKESMLVTKDMPLPKLRNLRDRNCNDETFSPGRMFLEFSYGAYKGNMIFKASESQFEDYRNLRDDGEVLKNGTNLQALIGFQIGKRLYFKTGISYTRVISDYYFIDQINKRTKTDSIFDPNTGDLIDVITTEEDIFFTGQNSYTFVDIPLLISYGWQFNKLGVGVTTGPLINLSFSREGRLPNVNGQEIDLESGEWNELGIYRRAAGLSWLAGVHISYQTYRNVELFVEPRIVAGLNSITLEDDGLEEDVSKRAYPLSQKMFQYGLNVGLRYVINN